MLAIRLGMGYNDRAMNALPELTPLFRFRCVVELTRPATLPPLQHGVLYGLFTNAAVLGQVLDKSGMPDGLWLDAPEQCRTQFQPGDQLAFGGTWFIQPLDAADRLLNSLCRGIQLVGLARQRQSDRLGGNFRLVAIEDLVSHRRETVEHANRIDGLSWQPISAEHIAHELERLEDRAQLTLQFSTPLRLERPEKDCTRGHAYFDSDYFSSHAFLNKILARMQALKLVRHDGSDHAVSQLQPDDITVALNHLTWVNYSTGDRERVRGQQSNRKTRYDDREPKRSRGGELTTYGGVVGRVQLRGVSPAAKAALVWGQYLRLGRSLARGQGAYRIAELGEDPFLCRRSTGLLSLALSKDRVARIGATAGMSDGELQTAAQAARDGNYLPPEPSVWDITDAAGKLRRLSVPPDVDRALQRCVLEFLSPALDKFLEPSSLAWRKGRSRADAARLLAAAERDGFQFALRADFDRFFDRIDRGLLLRRVAAFIHDASLTDLVAKWICAGASDTLLGLPIGAPITCQLSYLLINELEQYVNQEGGRLVHQVDCFKILMRTQEDIERWQDFAWRAVQRLLLDLNSRSCSTAIGTKRLSVFGFELELDQHWRIVEAPTPQRLAARNAGCQDKM